MYVCICHGVTENEIHAEISCGARTEEEIGDRTGAGTGCGMCVDKICVLLRAHAAGRGKIAAEAVI